MSGLVHETLADSGFADRSILPVLLRRIGLRAAVSGARSSIETLAHLLDQQREPLTGDDAALLQERIGLTACDEESCVARGAIHLRECNRLREDELLQGVHLVSQLLDRIEVGIRHGLFSCAGEPEGKPACDAAHRLSGGAK
jgi:hypothetical protein